MEKEMQEKVKEVRCNKCGKYFTSKIVDNSRIHCPACGSNESLSIRPKKSTPKPIREYLEELKTNTPLHKDSIQTADCVFKRSLNPETAKQMFAFFKNERYHSELDLDANQ